MGQAAVYIVRPGFGDDVDYTAGRAAELGAGAGGHDLELPHGFHADVHGSPLASDLFAEESIVVVAAIEGNVVEDAALPGKVDLVAVRALHDADSGRECQQILEFAPEHGSVTHGEFIQRDAGLHSCHFDWLSGNRHLFRYAGYSHRDWQR